MNFKSSKHIPRAYRIQFAGSPETGRIEVRCKAAVDFDLVLTSRGWVVTMPGSRLRSVMPLKPRDNPYAAYLVAIAFLWNGEADADHQLQLLVEASK